MLNARVVGGALLLALPSAPDAPLAVLPLASCEVEAAASGGAGGASGLIGWGTLAPPSTALTELRLVSSVHSATLRLPAFIANGAPGELGAWLEAMRANRAAAERERAETLERLRASSSGGKVERRASRPGLPSGQSHLSSLIAEVSPASASSRRDSLSSRPTSASISSPPLTIAEQIDPEYSARRASLGPASPAAATAAAAAAPTSPPSLFDMSDTERAAMDARLRAAAFVVSGGWLIKFVAGKRLRHSRFVRMLGSSGTIVWGTQSGRVEHADPTPRPDLKDGAARLQKEQRLTDEELRRCFQVVLDNRTLLMMAASVDDKQMWVAGINAVLSGLYF